MKKGSKIPLFKSEEEMAEFWETHTSTDYLNELEEVELIWEVDDNICLQCGGRMEEWNQKIG